MFLMFGLEWRPACVPSGYRGRRYVAKKITVSGHYMISITEFVESGRTSRA